MCPKGANFFFCLLSESNYCIKLPSLAHKRAIKQTPKDSEEKIIKLINDENKCKLLVATGADYLWL